MIDFICDSIDDLFGKNELRRLRGRIRNLEKKMENIMSHELVRCTRCGAEIILEETDYHLNPNEKCRCYKIVCPEIPCKEELEKLNETK